MATVVPKTVGESLFWSYANLAMAFTGGRHNEPTYQQIDYVVRNKLYYGLLRGTCQITSFLKDEREKLDASDACCYCGSQSYLTLDHLIPQFKGGKHSADNLVVACRSCNSSKGALDLMGWMAKKKKFPPLRLLRRYLKLAIQYCVENGLMGVVLEPGEFARSKQKSLFDDFDNDSSRGSGEVINHTWPFAIELIPHNYPDPVDLTARVYPSDDGAN